MSSDFVVLLRGVVSKSVLLSIPIVLGVHNFKYLKLLWRLSFPC